MAQVPVSYTNAKTAMAKVGLPVSAGTNWTNVDVASWNTFLVSESYYTGGYTASKYKEAYGFAFPGEMPQMITNAVGAENYTATLAAAPLTGTGPTLVTLTLTETDDNGQSFVWNFGDGSALTTTMTPTTTHTYETAGTYTATVVPTVHGLIEHEVTVTAPVVITA
jgi:PKD repeat protein